MRWSRVMLVGSMAALIVLAGIPSEAQESQWLTEVGDSNEPPNLFLDDFNGPNLNPIWEANLPDAPWRFGAHWAIYQGASSFAFQLLEGHFVIRLQNTLEDAQRRGWSSSTGFTTDAPVIYEARFNTMLQSPTTGIDHLLEIWLLDFTDLDLYDMVTLCTPEFGSGRVFAAYSSLTGLGIDTYYPFTNNTWYRLVISGSPTQEVRASLFNDAGTAELTGVNLGHNLSAYSVGFRIGFSQAMGFPHSPSPTDVAIDSIRLAHTLIPQLPAPRRPSGRVRPR
jgi:hypothetical protein